MRKDIDRIIKKNEKGVLVMCLFLIAVVSGLLFWRFNYTKASKDSYPKLANFYLYNPITDADVDKLAKWDVLVIHMLSQNYSATNIQKIRLRNPDIKILAYVPSEEFPITYYRQWDPGQGLFYKLLNGISPDMWLLDEDGKHVKFWKDNWMLNLSDYKTNDNQTWNDYLSNFVVDEILSTGLWDGIFFDNVWTGIAWINEGQIDIDNDGINDHRDKIDKAWKDGNEKLFTNVRQKYGKDVILVGNGDRGYYSYLNGLYMEDYLSGSRTWSDRMQYYVQSVDNSKLPDYTIVGNSPRDTTSGQADFQSMRYGLTSALLKDGYFGFDKGSSSHAEQWWYDEYNIRLGGAVSEAVSKNSYSVMAPDVWKRGFENGLVLVNSTSNYQTIELGTEYEKIQGSQDSYTNDGSIIDTITLPPGDGVIMLRTLQSKGKPIMSDLVVENGSFLRFYNSSGSRVRNGFFVFDNNYPAGTLVYFGDLDGKIDKEESIIISDQYKVLINDDQGRRLYLDYPFGFNSGERINMAVGSTRGGVAKQIALCSSGGGQIKLLNDYGAQLRNDFHLFGKNDKTALSLALGNVDGGLYGEVIVGYSRNGEAEVRIYDQYLAVLKNKIVAGKGADSVQIASGDVAGDKNEEIIVALVYKNYTDVKIYSGNGTKLSEFRIAANFGDKVFAINTLDADFDGKKDVVLMSK